MGEQQENITEVTAPRTQGATKARLSGASVGRGLVAPMAGYAATLLAAVVVTALAALAAALGAEPVPQDTEVDVEPTGALSWIVGLPVQLTSLGLFGVASVHDAGVGLSFFGVPVLLTLVYVATTGILARREERLHPVATGVERLKVALIGSVALAALATGVAALASLRLDGEELSAASPSLFLGGLLLSAVSSLAGRCSASGHLRRWRSRLPHDVGQAGLVWSAHLAAWLVLAVPLLVLAVWVTEGLPWALLAPLWAPTAALWAYGIGHFGGLRTSAGAAGLSMVETSSGWSLLGAWGFAVALACACVLALLTAVGWHLRRERRSGWLDSALSWAPLPLAFVMGTLTLMLVSTLRLGGDLLGMGGAVTFRLAVWTAVVMGLWGLGMEFASRTLAPRLVPALPRPVTSLLMHRATDPHPLSQSVVDGGGAATSAAPREPMTPEQRRRARRLSAVVGAVLAAVVAMIALLVWLSANRFSPEARAVNYLDAVVAADVEEALRHAPVSGDPTLLTEEVYRAAEERIVDYDVIDVEQHGDTDTAVATVRLDYGSATEETGVELEAVGRRWLLFDAWEVTAGGLAREISMQPPAGVDSIEVNDVVVNVEGAPGGEVALPALPGRYSVDLYAASPWMSGEPEMVEVTADPLSFAMVTAAEPKPSEAFWADLDDALDSWLATCMEASELEPDGCPQSSYAFAEEVRKVRWSLVEKPTLSAEYWDGTFPMTLDTEEPGQASVTYEENEAFFADDRDDWEVREDSSSLYVQAEVDLVEGELVINFSSW